MSEETRRRTEERLRENIEKYDRSRLLAAFSKTDVKNILEVVRLPLPDGNIVLADTEDGCPRAVSREEALHIRLCEAFKIDGGWPDAIPLSEIKKQLSLIRSGCNTIRQATKRLTTENYDRLTLNITLSPIDIEASTAFATNLQKEAEKVIAEIERHMEKSPAKRHVGNHQIQDIIEALCQAWEEIFETEPTAAINPVTDEAGNPFTRFIEAALKCGDRPLTPTEIRGYMRRRNNRRANRAN